MKLQRAVYPIINTVIRALLLLIVFGMWLQSMYSTSFVGVITKEDGSLQERTLNLADQPWKHLLLFVVFTVVGVLLCRGYVACQRAWTRRKQSAAGDARHKKSVGDRYTSVGGIMNIGDVSRVSKYFVFCSTLVLVASTVWILMTQLYPGSDPAKVYRIAMQWRRGDFSAYAEGGYLFRYPFQAGIILFYYLLSFLFGLDNYIGLQFVNVIALTAVYGLLVKLSALFWREDRKLWRFVYAALLLWAPLAFYVTYLYGILPGMALSLGAVYCAVMYLHTRRYRYILPAALCMGLATVIKMNCLIYLVAVACFLLYDALDIAFLTKKELGKQWIGSLGCLALMILGVIGCNQICSRYVERLSGYEAGEGEVMVSWVVMGLQETPLGPGGYSGYISDIFELYEYDTEKITEASIADIKKIMTRMSENPLDDGLPFFARKNAFQWNDPTFISLDRTKGRKAAGNMPAFAQSLIEGKGSVYLSIWLNYAQTLLLFGAILYLLFTWKSRNLYELMGAVVFLGGYLFHFFWESSASYTIPYFVLLIPYAVKGLAEWIRCAGGSAAAYRRDGRKWYGERKQQVRRTGVCVLAVVVLTALFSRTNLFDRTIALDDGEEAARQFYHRGDEAAEAGGWTEGYYYLSPYTVQNVAVTTQDGHMTTVSVMSGADSPASLVATGEEDALTMPQAKGAITSVSKVRDIGNKVLVLGENGGVCLRFRSNERVLAIDRGGVTPTLTTYLDDGMNSFYEPGEDMDYHWKMRAAGDGGYYMTIDDLALTYRNGGVTLEELSESEEQKWILQP